MLAIQTRDEGGNPRMLTVTTKRTDHRKGFEDTATKTVLRLYDTEDMEFPGGTLLGSIMLSPEDTAELKRNLL